MGIRKFLAARRFLLLTLGLPTIGCGGGSPPGGGEAGEAGTTSGGGPTGGSSGEGGAGAGGSSTGGVSGAGEGGEAGEEQGGRGGSSTGGTAGGGEGGAGEAGESTTGGGGTGGTGAAGMGGFAGGGVGGLSGSGSGGGGSGGIGGGGGSCSGTSCCIKVAPDGDDAAAAASEGETPFRNIQPAIDFADSHRAAGTRVCVAGGPTCSDGFTFTGPSDADLTMRDGVSVYGGYESTSFTRCDPLSPVAIQPLTTSGVVFDADIQSETTLDGLEVYHPVYGAPTASTITLRGASHVHLSSLVITGEDIANWVGLDILDGQAIVSNVIIKGIQPLSTEGSTIVGARSVDSRLTLDATLELTVQSYRGSAYGVWLENAPDSTVSADIDFEIAGQQAAVVGVRVLGDADGVEIIDGALHATSGVDQTIGVWLEDCEGAAPLVRSNSIIARSGGEMAAIEAVRSVGDCHPRIESNIVSSVGRNSGNTTAVRCSPQGGVPSRCVIVGNDIHTENPRSGPGPATFGVGIRCDEGSCESISRNSVTGLLGIGQCMRSCGYDAYGIDLRNTDTRIERNRIVAGCGDRAAGIRAEGATSRVENNFIYGRPDCYQEPDGVRSSVGIVSIGSNLDVHSNTIDGGGATNVVGSCTSAAVAGSGGTYRNNIFGAGVCNVRAAIFSGSLDFLPPVSGSPNLAEYNFSGDPLFVAFPDDLHVVAGSPCVNAGTTAGAPDDDIDGDSRDHHPDIGADEFVVSECAGASCSGHGACEPTGTGSGARCDCNPGYANPQGDDRACEDVNECATDNGGCDPLTTCTNTDGSRSCGPCPEGFTGDGETGCFGPAAYASISAGNLHSCAVRSDGALFCWGSNERGQSTPPSGLYSSVAAGFEHTCALRTDGNIVCFGQNGEGQASPPPGTFTAVAAGRTHSCGIRTDGSIACWGSNWSDESTPPAGTFTAVAAGYYFSCGLRTDLTIECWGRDDTDQATPPAGAFRSISCGAGHACGVRATGALACWGFDNEGQVSLTPTGTFEAVAAGGQFTCALGSSGEISCWGRETDGTTTPPSGTFELLAAGIEHACSVSTAGTIACWGTNSAGQTDPP